MRSALLVAEGRWRRPEFLIEGSAVGQFGLQFGIIEPQQTRIKKGGGLRDRTEPLLISYIQVKPTGETHSAALHSQRSIRPVTPDSQPLL